MSKKFKLGLLALLLSAPLGAKDLCVGTGYTFGFFNGVWNTQEQASKGMMLLSRLYGQTYNGEPIQYEAFYNHTGSSAGATSAQDLAEVFIQRADEIDASGELGKRWEYFWENLYGENRTLTDQIVELLPSSVSLIEQLYTNMSSQLVAAMSDLLSNPPTEADYATHNSRLDALALQQQKMMLVAHSQGNLFVNKGYDHIVSTLGADSVKVVHIAPASPTLRGEHVLADIDLVINGLRIQGLDSVPPVTIALPFSSADLSGHTLADTYLDVSRAARGDIKTLVGDAMSSLIAPPTQGNAGSFTVTLTWDGPGDVDLHVTEPLGSHVYYGHASGESGYLDVDNTSAYGPEHYFATCDSSALAPGEYSVGINNYSRATGRVATIQAASSTGGVIATQRVTVGPELGSSGNYSPSSVFSILVAKDDATGNVTYSLK